MERTLPSETTIRKKYLEDTKNDIIQKIRAEIGDSCIYISIDETTDKEGRYIANVIVGALNQSSARPHLIHLEHLEKTNAQTIARTMNSALQILWPGGIKHDRVLLFVSDAAAYMKKAGKDLAILYTKMIHVTCLAHGLHRVAEHIRTKFSKADNLVNNTKKVFLKAPNRVHFLKEKYPDLPVPPKPIITRWGTWLDAVNYYVTHWEKIHDVVLNLEDESLAISKAKKLFQDERVIRQLYQIEEFSNLTEAITKLQNTQRPMKDTLEIWNNVVEQVGSTTFVSIRNKMDDVATKNVGLEIVKLIDAANVEELKKFPQFSEIGPQQLLAFKYAPLASVDVERSFNVYKNILDDNLRNFKIESL